MSIPVCIAFAPTAFLGFFLGLRLRSPERLTSNKYRRQTPLPAGPALGLALNGEDSFTFLSCLAGTVRDFANTTIPLAVMSRYSKKCHPHPLLGTLSP